MQKTSKIINSNSDYYTKRAARFLWQYDRISKRLHTLLTQTYGADFATAVCTQTRQGFQDIIPQLPYIGGSKNIFTVILINRFY
ncbi:MAG: hypothetical protein GY943_16275 [Chloroflexi bacterium]|nr:hypothetical protein [Chloroflexota bacterium]